MRRQRDDSTGVPAEHSDSGQQGDAHAPVAEPGSPPPRRPLWNNLTTMAGMFLAIAALLGLLTFGLFQLAAPVTNPYVDILGYLIMPGVLAIGLIAMPLGILLRSWKLHRLDARQRLILGFPRIDLSEPAQRRAAKVVVIGTFILLPVVGVSSYHGYHYTDSTEFCAQACHSVMAPEAETYASSGHARVPCAECHIGAGASWFVKAKLSGTRQVIAVLRNSYSRPIPPAIKHLRPARETCEQCHWPERFFGDQLADLVRFSADENNTPHRIQMLLKTGGGRTRSAGHAGGIHKHVDLTGRIEYVATDDKLQEIPWVKMTREDGREVVYRSDGRPHDGPRPIGRTRLMDCMDCHNRPAHHILPPAEAVDLALRDGAIDPTIPFIKREAVAAMVQPYANAGAAAEGIVAAITEFYRNRYPDAWSTREDTIRQAIKAIETIYRGGFFSEMKVDWRTYPNNIGHLVSPGCFRCHDGTHVDEHGDAISHACATCHTFLNPGESVGETVAYYRGGFVHPVELQGRHADFRCDQCHTGGISPSRTCEGCHVDQAEFRAGAATAFSRFDIPAEPMNDSVSCEGCHDLTKRLSVEAIDTACIECHDEEYEGMLVSWKGEVDRLLAETQSTADAEGGRVLEALRQAGPLHNMAATRMICRELVEGR